MLPLSRRLAKHRVHLFDVVRVEADGRLVKDVSDVGQRRAQVADHLDPLGLAAGERPGRSIQAEIAEANAHE